ncbi:MAG: glycosyltransferase family 39 protein [Acidobacteriota bacterium]|nr:MAG: glycosyltransferase family 39 protein [Acidobacteriota bacterium]
MSDTNLPQTEPQKQSDWGFLAALALLCLVFTFYGSSGMPFLGPDEPRYAEVAREMYASGDWITPRLAGVIWFEKPALTYWLAAAGFSLLGVSEFAARFGVGLMATFGVFLLFIFGRGVRSSRFGYLAAATLVSSGLWIGLGRGATFDMPLAVTMELALVGFFLWMRKPGARNPFFRLFSFALGLAVIAKGLVGVVLPLAVIGLYLLIAGRLKSVLRPSILLTGAAIFLATASVWYAPVIARHGETFIREFFIAHHFQRYLSNKYRHPQPVWFFVFIITAGVFPWSFLLLSRVWRAVRGWRLILERRFDDLNLYLWLWLLVPLVFFSFSGSKLPGYILPVFPAAALLIAQEAERWWSDERGPGWTMVATAIAFFLTGTFYALGGTKYFGIELFGAYRLAIFMIMTSIILLGLWFLLGGRAAVRFLPFGFALIVMVLVNVFSPVLGERDSIRRMALTARRVARPGERLIFFVNHHHGINFYATELPLRDERSELVTVFKPEDVLSWMQRAGSEKMLLISPRRWFHIIENAPQLKAHRIAEQNGAFRCEPECNWILSRVEKSRK